MIATQSGLHLNQSRLYSFSMFRRPLSLTLPITLTKKRTRNCLAQFRSGNEEAYAKLYHRFRRPILRYVKSRLSNQAIAEEVTQDIFMKVHRFRESYNEEYAFSTWLWTIARNTIADYLRGVQNTASDGKAHIGQDAFSLESL